MPNTPKPFLLGALMVVLLTLGSCSLLPRVAAPVGVDPFPLVWTMTNGHAELCDRETPGECLDPRLMESARDRNEMQHMLLGTATDRCHEFKRTLYGMTKAGIGFNALSQLSAAASAIVDHDPTSRAAAAAGTAVGAIGGDFDGYFRETKLAIALSGIELARTRIFKSILEDQNKSLEEYPITRAVNDALRYHNVCTLADGLSESAGAVEAATNNL